MKSIFEGLEHIHACDIIHRDIKPSNIILNSHSDFSELKIADFGLSI